MDSFFYPHDKFGLVVIENTGAPLPDILEREVADRVLNLTIADVTLPDRPPKQPFLCAPSSSLPLAMSKYAGTYTSPGFGNFTDFRTADRVTRNISASGTQKLYAA
jgi:hypothetical protein